MNSAAVLLPPAKQRSLYDLRIVLSYLLGTVSGALLTAVAAWVLSGLLAPLGVMPRLFLLTVAAIFVWLCKHGPLVNVIKLPEARRQIPAEIFGGSMVRGAYLFGLELGTGMRTYTATAAPYLLLLTLLLGHLPLGVALLMGVGYGVGRAVPIMAQFSLPHSNRFAQAMVDGVGAAAPLLAALLTFLGGIYLV